MLERSDAAAILTVNSILSYEPEPQMVATAAARAGAQSLVKSLAREFAPRIRVNSVLLGLIESGQWERRFAARKDMRIQLRGVNASLLDSTLLCHRPNARATHQHPYRLLSG